MLRQPDQFFGRRRQRPGYRLEQPNPDRKLNDQRPQATDGIYAVLFVGPHRFAGKLLAVLGVAFLNGLQLGLQVAHLLQLTALPHRKWNHDGANYHSKRHDSHAEI